MKVLFVASECTPVVKVGGLGDVIGSLPKALLKSGVEVTVAIPGYQTIDFSAWVKDSELVIHFNGQPLKVTVYKSHLPGSEVPLLAFCESKYIGSGGIYFSKTAFSSSQDEIDRFAVFDEAVTRWILNQKVRFDIVHAHDWHTGMLFHLIGDDDSKVKKVFTIHNLANQGLSALEVDQKLGGHISHDQLLEWDARDHSLDLMLQGIGRADWITTVSPSYAKEILTPVFGEHLEEILRSREGRITGILNGIDYDFWNPGVDPLLSAHYRGANYQAGRGENRLKLEKLVGLDPDSSVPLFGFIGRLTNQKGLDLILGALTGILNGGKLMVLGKGEKEIEEALSHASGQSDGRMVYINTEDNFHEDYEHLMYGACDFFLVPSRFEPCGLVQMIAMHYGSVPVAHAVGGLKDSIKDGNDGFLFSNYSAEALLASVKRAKETYKSGDLGDVIKLGMAEDFSWTKSAKAYISVYEKVLSLS